MARREAALGTLCGLALALGAGALLDPVLLTPSARQPGLRVESKSAGLPNTPEPKPPALMPRIRPARTPGVESSAPPSPAAPRRPPAGSGRVELRGLDAPAGSGELRLDLQPLDGGPRQRVALGEVSGLRLAPGRYEVSLRAPGFLPSAPQVISVTPGRAASLRLAPLEPARALKGRVEGPPHLVLSQVELELRSLEVGIDRRQIVACAPGGEFEQGELPEGDYQVRARSSHEDEVYLSPWGQARAGSGAGKGLLLRLARAEPSLAGRVFDALGSPVAGALVRVSREEERSDSEGRYRLYGAPSGTGWLEVEAEGFLSQRKSVTLGAGTGCDVSLTRVCVVEGQLVGPAGEPRAGARVVLFQVHGPGTHTSQSVVSDAEGRFRFEPLLPGTYALGDDPALEPLSPAFQLEGGRAHAASLRSRSGD